MAAPIRNAGVGGLGGNTAILSEVNSHTAHLWQRLIDTELHFVF